MSKIKTNWNLEQIAGKSSEKGILALRNRVEKESYRFINKWNKRSDYLHEPQILRRALDEYDNWQENYGANSKEWYYRSLKLNLDQDNPQLKARLGKARELGLKIQNDIQFFELDLSKVDREIQKKFLNSGLLTPYKHFLEKLFSISPYLLSVEGEKIMNFKAAPAHSNWTKMLQEFLSKEEREIAGEDGKLVKRNFPSLMSLMESKNKPVRDNAAKAFNEILAKHRDLAEHELNSVLLNKKVDDEIRGYERPDRPRHLSDDIDSGTVDMLVSTVSSEFDIARKYYSLKAKLLGVKRLEYHERNVEYGDIDLRYSVDHGFELVRKVFANLDREFKDILENMVREERIDFYPRKGKRDGAFCSYNLLSDPVFVLLNWTDKLDDVRTFAHEMGHAVNDELIKKSQTALNFGTPTSTAEVASTFMEDFVIQELLNGADEEQKLSLMVAKLNQDISSIFRQIACYKFEQELHSEFRKKGYLSHKEIGNLFIKHMSSYMGDSVSYKNGENWWIYWSHIRNFFYNYSYASGLLISKSLQASVKKDPEFIVKVKEFLSAGLSDSPKNIFTKLGIDIDEPKFWERGIGEINSLLEETILLAKKLGKIN